MVERSIFGRVLSFILLTLGIYLIAINVISIYGQKGVLTPLPSDSFDLNFYGWHSSFKERFRGFSWFYEKIETFPSINNTINFVTKLRDFSTWVTGTPSDIIGALIWIGKILTFPVSLVIVFLVDIVNNILWFLGFIF